MLPGVGLQTGTELGGVPPASEVLAHQLGRSFSFEFGFDQAMTMFQPVGGMDRIPYALEKTVGTHRIRYSSQVRAISNLDSGVEVTYRAADGRTRVVRGDYCIAAMPPHILARTRHNLGADVTAALGYAIPQPVGKIGLEYGRRWWEQDYRMYGGITETDMDLDHVWYPSYDFHGGRGVVVGYYNTGADALTYGKLTAPERVRRAVAQGAKIHGDVYRSELASAFSVAWHRTPFVEGGWVSWPSQTGPQYRRLLQPAGRVYFAGDWLTHWIAWQHGAFISARSVVGEIHKRAVAAN